MLVTVQQVSLPSVTVTGETVFNVSLSVTPTQNVTVEEAGTQGPAGSASPKAISLQLPQSNEKIALFHTASEITFTKITSLVVGNSPSVTFSIRYGDNFSDTGTEVVTGGITVTNTTTGLETTSFNNATVGAGNFVWITTSALSGTVNQLHVTLEF